MRKPETSAKSAKRGRDVRTRRVERFGRTFAIINNNVVGDFDNGRDGNFWKKLAFWRFQGIFDAENRFRRLVDAATSGYNEGNEEKRTPFYWQRRFQC